MLVPSAPAASITIEEGSAADLTGGIKWTYSSVYTAAVQKFFILYGTVGDSHTHDEALRTAKPRERGRTEDPAGGLQHRRGTWTPAKEPLVMVCMTYSFPVGCVKKMVESKYEVAFRVRAAEGRGTTPVHAWTARLPRRCHAAAIMCVFGRHRAHRVCFKGVVRWLWNQARVLC